MALLAALVIFTVIARYCFSLSWKQLAEFNTTLFAFTTFWGMGINVIKDEHVMIDILYDGVKPARKRWLAIVNYLIVLAVVLVFTYQGFKYVGVAGKQISQGMEIPMMYMYGIMPVPRNLPGSQRCPSFVRKEGTPHEKTDIHAAGSGPCAEPCRLRRCGIQLCCIQRSFQRSCPRGCFGSRFQ